MGNWFIGEELLMIPSWRWHCFQQVKLNNYWNTFDHKKLLQFISKLFCCRFWKYQNKRNDGWNNVFSSCLICIFMSKPKGFVALSDTHIRLPVSLWLVIWNFLIFFIWIDFDNFYFVSCSRLEICSRPISLPAFSDSIAKEMFAILELQLTG